LDQQVHVYVVHTVYDKSAHKPECYQGLTYEHLCQGFLIIFPRQLSTLMFI